MKIIKFPNLRQTYSYDCGVKAIQSVLVYYGIDVKEDIIMNLAGTSKSGTPLQGIKKVAEKYKLKSKLGRMTIEDVKKYIDKKIPVILLIQAWTDKKNMNWEKHWADGHYVVAIGYGKNKMYFEDPNSTFRTYLTYNELKKRWHDIIQKKKYINYGLAVYGKKAFYNPNKIIHMD